MSQRTLYDNQEAHRVLGDAGELIVSDFLTSNGIIHHIVPRTKEYPAKDQPLDIITKSWGIEVKYCGAKSGKFTIDRDARERKEVLCRVEHLKPLTIAVVPLYMLPEDMDLVELLARADFMTSRITSMQCVSRHMPVKLENWVVETEWWKYRADHYQNVKEECARQNVAWAKKRKKKEE